MRYNDRRFSIEGGAGLMGKYQLKSRKEGSVITLLEVDTECRAWYVKADDKDAAVKTLISMGESIRCLESIYVNGDDMTEDILSAFSAARKTSYPEEFMPESETDDFAPQGSYMPPEEMMPDDVPPPDEYGYEEAGAAPLSPLPSAEEIEAAASQSGREEASIADERPSEFAMPDILPDLASVLPRLHLFPLQRRMLQGPSMACTLARSILPEIPLKSAQSLMRQTGSFLWALSLIVK